jgi:Strictosidine synthase
MDAYHGLFRLDLDTNRAVHLITANTTITPPVWHSGIVDQSAQLSPKFFNDLDIMEVGSETGDSRLVVHFTDSSYKHHRCQNRQEILDGAPRGRFFSFDMESGELTVLLCGLHFPNGVQALNSEEVLVVESTRFRILKVNLKKLGEERPLLLASCGEEGSLRKYLDSDHQNKAVSVFLDAVPGFMDNIRIDSVTSHTDRKHYFVGVGTTSSQPFSLLWLSYQLLLLRDVIGKILPMKYVENLIPTCGLVIVIDEDGQVVESLYDREGTKMKMISEAQRHPITGDLLMGSHSNPFLGKLSASNLNKK